jgi:hypothetical protein
MTNKYNYSLEGNHSEKRNEAKGIGPDESAVTGRISHS